jgi:hypothetical protein
MQLHMAALEESSDANGERLAALVALIKAGAGALALHLRDAFHAAAVRANRAFRPQSRLNVGKCLFFVVKMRGSQTGSHFFSPYVHGLGA